jgi:glycosyltransferase involved in cell wall biosynthesis
VRVVHFGYADDLPGAACASFRLHGELLRAGIDSWMVVAVATAGSDRVVGPQGFWATATTRLASRLDQRITDLLTGSRPERSLAIVGSTRVHDLRALHPDVVQLHWLGGGLVRPAGLRRLPDVPIVWRLPDEWPMSGTTHYATAPRSMWDRRLEAWAEHRKVRAYRSLRDLTVVAPTSWLAERARSSVAFAGRPVEVIATGVDLQFWSPGDRVEAAAELGLPTDRPIVLFGATGGTANPRKGWKQLARALAEVPDDVALATFGGTSGMDELDRPVLHLGPVTDEATLRCAYRAATVFVAPSLQENLPNTGLESLACGTPVVGFDVGGMSDLVEHRSSGWLASEVDPAALAEGIRWAVDAPEACLKARQRAEERFDAEVQGARYASLYRRLAGSAR